MNWFNQVDDTYRADLRELNELNFGRFDAKVEQRLAESDARWERRLAESDTKWERRFAESDTKWERRIAGLDAKVAVLGDTLRKELAQGLEQLKSDLLKWMFGFWASVVIALGVLAVRH